MFVFKCSVVLSNRCLNFINFKRKVVDLEGEGMSPGGLSRLCKKMAEQEIDLALG